MSRVNYDYDDYDPLSCARWEINSKAVVTSKRGQKALRELREALIALPQKRLVADTFCEVDDEGNVNACVLGAYALYKGIAPNAMGGLNGVDANETADWASGTNTLGLTFTLAWKLVEINDEDFAKMTPEGRYIAFMNWLDRSIHVAV